MKATSSQQKTLTFYKENSNWFDNSDIFLNENGVVVILTPKTIYKISRRGSLTSKLLEEIVNK